MKNTSFFLIVSTILFLASCKKVDNPSGNEKSAIELRNEILSKLQKSVEKNPSLKKIVVPVGEKVDGFFADLNYTRIVPPGEINAEARKYECADPFDMIYPPSSTLISYSYEYDCNQGYKFTFKWQVSISVNLLATGPGSAVSKGRVRVIGNGFPVYSDLNLTPITITDLGDDPNTLNDNILYEIIYETDWIISAYFGDVVAPTTFQTSFAAYTDCVDMPTYVTGYKTVTFDGTKACTRIDPLQVLPAEVNNGNYTVNGLIMGFGNILYLDGCPFPANYPDRYAVELKCIVPGKEREWYPISPEQGSWPGDVLTSGHLNPFDTDTDEGTIGLYDIYYIPEKDIKNAAGTTVVHGEYLVRHRNVMYAGCKGPWSDEILVEF